ncbi:hypothetical protein D1007_25427 [Hordeum vulgare]|nr:hypothetical protein D1007_25427 [Hordeum vulgare]KAI4993250.1 hypothetical protein ZWY2020_007563 [Hordeum vulgare]
MAVRLRKLPFSQYYIYHPVRDHGGDGRLELYRIEQPNNMRLVNECCAVGLISHGGGYIVAGLTMQEKGEFQLYIFSSETRAWTIKKPVLSLADGATDLGDYMPDMAIAVGGGGAMAFVNLWNGILFCNVLDSGEHPELCYLRLPSAELCRPHMNYELQPRDIAFDMSSNTIHIRFVEVVCPSFSVGWHVSTWTTTTTAMSPWRQQEKGWQQVTKLYDHELLVADGVSTDGLLPEVSELADMTFGNLLVDMPMLSLHENKIICFLAKHHIADYEVWAIAVDMETKKLKGVNLLQVGRCTRLFYSTISNHLTMIAAALGNQSN